MDKAQKELIGTYFRKRGIAQEKSERYRYTSYELIYFIENGVDVDLNESSINNIIGLLQLRPDLINKFDLSKLDGDYIARILNKLPHLINAHGLNGSRFNFNKLNDRNEIDEDNYDVNDDNTNRYILSELPELAKYFTFEIYTSDESNTIANILIEHPHLVNAHGLNGSPIELDRIYEYDIYRILKYRIEILDVDMLNGNKFNLTLLDDSRINDLIEIHPEYSNKLKYGNLLDKYLDDEIIRYNPDKGRIKQLLTSIDFDKFSDDDIDWFMKRYPKYARFFIGYDDIDKFKMKYPKHAKIFNKE